MSVLNVVSPLKLRAGPIMPGGGKRPPAGPAPGGNAVIKEARAGMTPGSADAAGLAEMLSFTGHRLAGDPAASAHHRTPSRAAPPTASGNCATTPAASSSCPAAAAARSFSAVTATDPVKKAHDNGPATPANPGAGPSAPY